MQDIDRRHFLASAAATGTLLASPPKLFAQNSMTAMPQIAVADLTSGSNVPYAMDLRTGSHNFGTGAATDTFGINSDYLGPLVKVRRGQEVQFDVTNNIGELTAVHWHGLHIPGDVDGGPHQSIQPGATWSLVLTIDQPAGLNWFHAHTHGHTMPQVYKGLAGLLLIEDDDSIAADLPKTFGVEEFAVVLQDKHLRCGWKSDSND
ncbi:multicopper oxidase domain-containing protein [Ruegeria halocynthiae]|uniref:multicopper oxidase domain-containing protein n=1 Tax=Ruegeria halocynthiae TaxID=985054 RepID=UPI000691C33D|nr:multicopper oxidase domain-containing protein [Ruegeria halocynthiae]